MGGGGDVKPNPVEVGIRIKNIRLNKRMTGTEFGKMVDNANKGLVSAWEKGRSLPGARRLGIIADFAEITVHELLYGTIEEVEQSLSNFTTEQLLDEIKRRLNS
jgi:transcriptional regulator with XRE-family HTH domain